MDNTALARALERFVIAEPERRLPILRQIIKKFDPASKIEASDHGIDVRLASFEGTLSAHEVVAIHIALAKAADLNRDTNALQNVLIHLLSIRSLMPFETFTASRPTMTRANDLVSYRHSGSKIQLEFPVEIWSEILQWVPRCDLKVLLNIPHRLRGPASELYFREILLHFDAYPPHFPLINLDISQSAAWQSQRSLEILARIMRDVPFAHRIRTLTVSVDNFALVNLDFEMVLISKALTKLKNLRSFECGGMSEYLSVVIAAVPAALPQLESFTARSLDSRYPLPFAKLSASLKCLRNLAMSFFPTEVATLTDLIRDLEPSLRHLRVHDRSHSINVLPAITPVLGNLVHLELSVSASNSGMNASAVVEAILCHDSPLETLGLGLPSFRDSLPWPSVHFRTYAHALPQLRNFAFHFVRYTLHDRDILPAISEFLQGRPHLESLELVDDYDDHTGFHSNDWSFLSSLPRLRRLAMIVPDGFPMHQATGLIPRTVRSLGLSGYGAYAWFCTEHLESASEIDWPEQLRLISTSRHWTDDFEAVARRVAVFIPSVCVVKIRGAFFTVAKRKTRSYDRIIMEKWSSHKVRQLWVNQLLEACDCDAQPSFLSNYQSY